MRWFDISKDVDNYNVDTSRSYKVVKANSLIQQARFSLSSQEQKITLFIISKIKPEDAEFKEYKFGAQEFCRVCGIDYTGGKNNTILNS